MGRRIGQRGFTLVEVLVASVIFAIIMSMAYIGIQGAARQRNSVAATLDRFHQVQRAVQILSRDLFQLQPRPVRDLLGDSRLAAITTGTDGGGIEMTTGGWSNPVGLPRSVLQRVGYEIEEDTLYRSRWPVLDRTQASVPVRQPLLNGIVSMSVRFFDASGDTTEDWPPLSTGGTGLATAARLPRAVEFSLELEDYGIVTRLIEVAQ